MVSLISIDMKAEDYFHKPPYDYNCAQAILKAYQKKFNIPENLIEEFKANGGGRAEDGICGALYSALYLMRQNPEELKAIQNKFIKQIGSPYCKTIKQNNNTPCLKCVNTAFFIVKDILLKKIDRPVE